MYNKGFRGGLRLGANPPPFFQLQTMSPPSALKIDILLIASF